jgi:membrane protein
VKPNSKQGIGDLISNFFSFIRAGIWRIRLADLPFGKSFLIRQLRIIILAFRGYDEDRCLLRASSLTFYTLLSIVPVAAMFFGVAKGAGKAAFRAISRPGRSFKSGDFFFEFTA